ncbi:MAG TPA: hypothetical protein PK208_08605 [Fibrobacteria bacterium]|nr:hypothetical protein [Fibrobacteria bacterium]
MNVNPATSALIGLFLPLAVSVLGAFTWRRLGKTLDLLSVGVALVGAVATGIGAWTLGQSGTVVSVSFPWL